MIFRSKKTVVHSISIAASETRFLVCHIVGSMVSKLLVKVSSGVVYFSQWFIRD